MLQRADIAGARPLVLIEASSPANAVGDARQESFDRLNQLALGREFQAQVLSRLTDGSFLVKIEDAVASMKLPPGTKTGDAVDLTLLATQPRPTFLLGKPDAGAGATSTLSNAGRLIGNLLQLAQQDGAAPTALVGKTPLVATPNMPPAQIAQALQNAVTFSGLFYESHVAQWAAGARPLAALLNEPNAKLQSPPTAATNSPATASIAPPHPQDTKAADSTTQPADLNKLLVNVKELITGEKSLPELLQSMKTTANSTAEGTASQTVTRQESDLTGEGVKLVSLQLDALEQRRIVWQGQLFPGQPMEWEISDDTPKRNQDDGGEPQEPSWQSTVTFSLPTLGTVAATIRLTGEHVAVNVRTSDDASAAVLRSYSALLSDALGAAGSTLDSLLVSHDG